ncbi:hypothetical protein OGAPHI_000323 [Ogataea philodendri]|uniref:RNA polymerase II subunit A C-terminal domain phosphatase n=2 Tax=Saccharomycotina TaxID=147537 RepID=A0A9P8PHH7_9ASCO|nr:uncharacterized protein OGAPHI_000323 [Ogataea philodendri]KAH3671620.1 hypothetical protein OGAPHI_000323 [Ogataea philodendri]
MAETTPIYLPNNLPYPLTVVKVGVSEGEEIKPHTSIVYYKYFDFEPVPLSEEDDSKNDESERKLIKVEYVGSFECPLEGTVSEINVKVGDKLKDASSKIVEIIEPCSHSIQYGGLCALCGKNIEEIDYSGFNDKDRAPISMSHGTTNLKVSTREAENIEKSSTQRLLKEEKLSLVVDLDQTVIHATVDPTVGEWMSDPNNPNYESIKDVKSFSLEEEAIVPPNYTGPKPPPHLRWYYVKLRPGLQEFLDKVAKLYELHIYTMATRSYAKNIAKIIDPDGIYFGDRILSRDESGSLTQKSLQRLFPVDTSMVVVIDDRGDVWNWSPNLIKVIPYDFFVGIGDINSSFLPRQSTLLGPSKRRRSVNKLEDQINSLKALKEAGAPDDENAISTEDEEGSESPESSESPASPDSPDSPAESVKSEDQPKQTDEKINIPLPDAGYSPVDRMMELGDGEDNTELLAAQETERTTVLEQQLQDRPLAKLQENLDKIIEEDDVKEHSPTKEEHNLLSDDDNELETLGQALVRIHNEFFFEVEKSSKNLPDVKDIMTSMKQLVFDGFVFLLSGVLPLGTPLETADIVIWAKSFGASFVANYGKSVTHVICKNPGTFKVRLAKSIDPNVKVVNPDWLFSCIALWEKVPEDKFIMEVDGLLSESEVNAYLKSHNMNGDKLEGENLDWDEIDEEMKEFLGSDYDEEDDDGNEGDESVLKRDREEDEAETSGIEKKQKTDQPDESDSSSDDDFEKELLEDLEGLEE